MVISPAPEYIIGIDILSNWHDPHTGGSKELFGYLTEGEKGCGRSENVVPKAQICSTSRVNSEHFSLGFTVCVLFGLKVMGSAQHLNIRINGSSNEEP